MFRLNGDFFNCPRILHNMLSMQGAIRHESGVTIIASCMMYQESWKGPPRHQLLITHATLKREATNRWERAHSLIAQVDTFKIMLILLG